MPPHARLLCYFVGNEFCERLAFYGLATNLVTYITRVMGGDPASAAIQVSLFEGTCYMTPLLGAVLADSKWGRYRTILVFSSIYFVVRNIARSLASLSRCMVCRQCCWPFFVRICVAVMVAGALAKVNGRAEVTAYVPVPAALTAAMR